MKDHAGVQKLNQIWCRFRRVFNCLPAAAHASLQPVDVAALRQEMQVCLKEFCFAALPPLANTARWLKRGPAIDWFMRCMVAYALLGRIWGLALKKKTLPQKPADQKEDKDAEQSWLKSVAWHAVYNRRVGRGRTFVVLREIPNGDRCVCFRSVGRYPLYTRCRDAARARLHLVGGLWLLLICLGARPMARRTFRGNLELNESAEQHAQRQVCPTAKTT